MNKKENFLAENSLDGGFLQSKYWANFQEKLGKTFHVVKVEEMQTLIIENTLPIVGKYFYIPRGPVFGKRKKENLKLIEEIKSLAKKKGAHWIRFEPQKKQDLDLLKGIVLKSKKNHQPAETLILDLNKSEEGLLAGMKQKTRYNIRLAEKKGLKIKVSKSKKELEAFWELVQETAKRDGVSFHDEVYYQNMLKSIPEANLELLMAYKGQEVIGAILVSFYGGVATYLHGASSNQLRHLMANYLLQWEAIKRAKEKGLKRYDFFGIAVNENRKKWAGITKFKTGFAPKVEPTVFPGCYDLILCPLRYIVYRILQMFK